MKVLFLLNSVEYLAEFWGFSQAEGIRVATATVAKEMGRGNALGNVAEKGECKHEMANLRSKSSNPWNT